MAHHRGLVITLVVAVVIAAVGIGVMGLATNDTDESVQDDLGFASALDGARRLSASEPDTGHILISNDSDQVVQVIGPDGSSGDRLSLLQIVGCLQLHGPEVLKLAPGTVLSVPADDKECNGGPTREEDRPEGRPSR